jgi:hypothetical protein
MAKGEQFVKGVRDGTSHSSSRLASVRKKERESHAILPPPGTFPTLSRNNLLPNLIDLVFGLYCLSNRILSKTLQRVIKQDAVTASTLTLDGAFAFDPDFNSVKLYLTTLSRDL